jgi:hypothetical protein
MHTDSLEKPNAKKSCDAAPLAAKQNYCVDAPINFSRGSTQRAYRFETAGGSRSLYQHAGSIIDDDVIKIIPVDIADRDEVA